MVLHEISYGLCSPGGNELGPGEGCVAALLIPIPITQERSWGEKGDDDNEGGEGGRKTKEEGGGGCPCLETIGNGGTSLEREHCSDDEK